MPRLMSVSLTEAQVRDRTKLVTRRLGWLMLEPGDTLTLCKKVMGRRKGEPLVRIVDVDVVSVRRERLDAITAQDVDLEGFPEWTPAEFVEFFCSTHKGCAPETEVTRIEWRWANEPEACRQPEVCGHEFSLSGVGYRCQRAPHPVDDGTNIPKAPYRHAAAIDAQLAEGTEEHEGQGDADLITWGEDETGEGQDWDLAWGDLHDFADRSHGTYRSADGQATPYAKGGDGG